jgi:hypothetical protein
MCLDTKQSANTQARCLHNAEVKLLFLDEHTERKHHGNICEST